MPFPPGSKFPYQVGFSLNVTLLRLYTSAQQVSPMEPMQTLTVHIEHLFEPPSRACVLVVSIEPEDAERYGLPQQAILKVCDRRFQQERLKDNRIGWSMEKEVLARQRWLRLKEEGGDVKSEYPRIGDRHWREAVKQIEPALAEDYYHRSAYGNYLRELVAYENLQELYGNDIPTLYASARIEPSSFFLNSEDAELPDLDAEFAPHAIIMEYIPNGRSLEDARDLTPGQRQQFRDALTRMHHLGVRHGDMKPDNLLSTGSRAVLFDFGYAVQRQKDTKFDARCSEEMHTLDSILNGTLRPR